MCLILEYMQATFYTLPQFLREEKHGKELSFPSAGEGRAEGHTAPTVCHKVDIAP